MNGRHGTQTGLLGPALARYSNGGLKGPRGIAGSVGDGGTDRDGRVPDGPSAALEASTRVLTAHGMNPASDAWPSEHWSQS